MKNTTTINLKQQPKNRNKIKQNNNKLKKHNKIITKINNKIQNTTAKPKHKKIENMMAKFERQKQIKHSNKIKNTTK